MSTLSPFADGLWEASRQVRFNGVRMPSRTVVVALGSGGVLVHSPGRLDDAIRAKLAAIGPVRALVAPNRYHHLALDAWHEAYPDAQVHVAPTLPEKRRDLEYAERLGDDAPALWSDDLEQHTWRGVPKLGEVVFFHKASRTLINTDMMHNMQDDSSWLSRTAWRLIGAYQRFGPTRLERRWTKDRAALRASLERVLDWDFDRVTVAHGDILEAGGKDQVRQAWSWVDSK